MATSPYAVVGALATLANREAALHDAVKLAKDLPGMRGEAETRKKALLTDLERQLAIVTKERDLRASYIKSTAESVADPTPTGFSPIARIERALRERTRAEARTAIAAQIAALRAANTPLYGDSVIADPCLHCNLNSVANEVKRINKLARVEFLNGYADADPEGFADPILTGVGNQWVNLADYRPRFERAALPAWLGSFDGQAVASFDRLSRNVRIIVEFDQPGTEQFWILLKPGGTNIVYTAEELKHEAYHQTPVNAANAPIWYSGTTNANGKAIVTLQVRAAGGDTWQVEGTDSYNTRKHGTGSLFTRRGLFLVTLHMDTVAAVTVGDAKAEYARHFIHLEAGELSYAAGTKVPHQYFMYADATRKAAEKAKLQAKVKTAMDAGTFKGQAIADLAPYVVATLFYDMSPAFTDRNIAPAAGPPFQSYAISVGYNLWDPNDTTTSWFKSASVEITKQDDSKETIALTADDLIRVGSDATGYKQLLIKPGNAAIDGAKSCRFAIAVRVINGGINGFSVGNQGDGSFIAICRRHSYKVRELAEMNQTIVHELGHKINFSTGPEAGRTPAANAARWRWLDPSAYHYTARGHAGSHCYYNARPRAGGGFTAALVADFSLYEGQCVMFGSGCDTRSIAYCPTCSEKVRKLNVETGWTGL